MKRVEKTVQEIFLVFQGFFFKKFLEERQSATAFNIADVGHYFSE